MSENEAFRLLLESNNQIADALADYSWQVVLDLNEAFYGHPYGPWRCETDLGGRPMGILNSQERALE